MFKCSVWNSGMFDVKSNELRENMFAQKVSNIKDVVIVEEHEEYIKVKTKTPEKIQQIINEDFEGNGWMSHEK